MITLWQFTFRTQYTYTQELVYFGILEDRTVHAAFGRTCGERYRSWRSSKEAPLSRVVAAQSGGHMQTSS